jgi:hypothetical protein
MAQENLPCPKETKDERIKELTTALERLVIAAESHDKKDMPCAILYAKSKLLFEFVNYQLVFRDDHK